VSSSTAPAASTRRALPSVSSLLERADIAALGGAVPRQVLVTAVRAAVSAVREGAAPPPAPDGWRERVAAELATRERSSLIRVINASGIVLHTNLGRAPLAPAAVAAVSAAAEGCSTLEFDLETGDRGSRHVHCISLLRELTGAEDALVVNNCAAALVLALNTLATGRDALISRGELIEIGGSFRIPEIMERSGARLVETGTTNRTHLLDYRASVTERTAAIVKVHRSNFAQTGYTADVPLRELSAFADERSLPLVFDLGSGLLLDLQSYGFPAEPTAATAVADGATATVMSGDKLIGGPQAGVIVGRAETIALLRANPLARALRVDKLTVAGLEATLRLYRDPASAVRTVPVLAMLCAPVETVRMRAESIARELRDRNIDAESVHSSAAVGAGAFPAHEIPSAAVALAGEAKHIAAVLRSANPPVIGRIRDGRVLLDLRSVQPSEDSALVMAVIRSLGA
jgi:L-seryl-tRNA(Ser) seleniumtransferase